MRDDAEKLRLSHAGRDAFEPDRPGDGASRFVGRVRSTSPNINIGKFLLVRPESAMGTEAENEIGAFVDLGSTDIPVLLLGPGLPATGDRLVVRSVEDRWVAKRKAAAGGGGGGGVVVSCTGSPVPTTLTLSFSHCHADGSPFGVTVSHSVSLVYSSGKWTATYTDDSYPGSFIPNACTEWYWELGCNSGSLLWSLAYRVRNPANTFVCEGLTTAVQDSAVASPFTLTFTHAGFYHFNCLGGGVVATVTA